MKIPVWKRLLPDMAVGDGDGRYLACPTCGNFLSIPPETVGGHVICKECGEELDLDPVFDEIAIPSLEN